MQISIMTVDGRGFVELLDGDNFHEFAVFIPKDIEAGTLTEALDEIGRAEGDDHVYVDRAKLLELAEERVRDSEWLASFEGMVAFARSKGWVNSSGAIRAHLERV